MADFLADVDGWHAVADAGAEDDPAWDEEGWEEDANWQEGDESDG